MGRSIARTEAVPGQASSLAVLAATSAVASVVVGLFERGVHDFAAPLRAYLGDVTLIGSGISFVRSFLTDRPIFSTPVRHHPPGFLLGLWVLDWMHAQGPGWALALVAVGAALIGPALVVLLGRRNDLRIAGAVVVVAALLWPVPAPGAFFVGLTAVGAALAYRGARTVSAVAGGLVLGAAMATTYVAGAAAAITVAVVAVRRSPTRAVAVAVPIAAVLLVVGLAGFWWWSGLAQTL